MPYQLHRKAAECAPAHPFKLLTVSTTGFGSGARQLTARQLTDDGRGRWTPEPVLDHKPQAAFDRSRPAAGVAYEDGESHG